MQALRVCCTGITSIICNLLSLGARHIKCFRESFPVTIIKVAMARARSKQLKFPSKSIRVGTAKPIIFTKRKIEGQEPILKGVYANCYQITYVRDIQHLG